MYFSSTEIPESESVSLCFSDFTEVEGTFMASSRLVFGLLVAGVNAPEKGQVSEKLDDDESLCVSPSLLLRQRVH